MSELNPLNDLSRIYLDKVALMNRQEEQNDVERWQGVLDDQMEKSSKKLATLGAPTMEEEKKAAKDYDGDGKVESGKDEYFGSKDKAIKKAMKKEELEAVDEGIGRAIKKAKRIGKRMLDAHDSDPGRAHTIGTLGNPSIKNDEKRAAERKAGKKKVKEEVELDEAERKLGDRLHRKRKLYDRTVTKAMDFARREGEAAGHARYRMGQLDREMDKVKDKMKKEGRFSDWRNDLSDLIEVAPMTDVEMEKEVTEKKVNNKVVINPKMSEAVAQIGGEVISETEVDLQEKQKDTPDQVKAVIAYDRARKGTDDATYDSMHGKKKQAKKERDYAKWQRDKGAEDAQKSGHRWKHAKGSTREKEGKKSETHAYIKDSFAVEGYGKKKKHNCASKVKHEEFGVGNCIKGMHTIDENNMVTHYDVEFKEYIVENCPVEELKILEQQMHEHVIHKEGVVSKEVKALQKAGKTLKDTPVVKADKIDTPNYKGQKFGVKEADDWIQGAVKRPGAFTRKAKAAGMSVQQFAKNVDDNPGKYSTRTKKQANLAQTFASMKKEDVEELFYTLIVD